MTRQPDAPRHVVASGSDADAVLRRLARDGWALREGFALPDPTWDVTGAKLVLHGRIGDPDTLQLAVLAAARGAGIVAAIGILVLVSALADRNFRWLPSLALAGALAVFCTVVFVLALGLPIPIVGPWLRL